MKPKISLLSAVLGLSAMALLGACHSKLLGNSDDNTAPAVAPVGEPEPTPAGRVDVFKDGGGIMNTDSNAGFLADAGSAEPMHFDIRNTTDAAEGSQYIHCHFEADHLGGHIRFSVDKLGTGHTIDLSGHTNIVFWMRLDRNHLASESAGPFFEDNAGHSKMVDFREIPGVDINSISWQHLSIPITALSGLDLTKMKTIFGLHSEVIDPTKTGPHVDFDEVYYE